MSYFAPYIDDSGIHMPTYEDRLEDLVSAYHQIFGNDIILDPSVPDYQLLSMLARALDDTSALVLDLYDSRNPAYASGVSLDLLAPQYAISRYPNETDAQLRIRIMGAMASKGCASVETMEAALKALQYVRDAKVYVNDTNATDARGIPAHTIAPVVYSGLPASIREVIYKKKAPGIGTYGSSSGTYVDSNGVSHTINYTSPSSLQITFVVKIKVYGSAFVLADQTAVMKQAIIDFVQGLGIGGSLAISRLYGVLYNAVPAELRTSFSVQDILNSHATPPAVDGAYVPCDWNKRLTTLDNLITFEEVT